MKITVLLADSAQTDQSGKVHALGLGWSITTSPTPPMAIVVFVSVEWHEANTPQHLTATLVTQDGEPVLVPRPNGQEEVRIDADFELGRPAGLPAGSPLTMSMALGVAPGIPLTPGERYRWRVTTPTEPDEDFGVSFFVRPQPQQASGGFGPASIPKF